IGCGRRNHARRLFCAGKIESRGRIVSEVFSRKGAKEDAKGTKNYLSLLCAFAFSFVAFRETASTNRLKGGRAHAPSNGNRESLWTTLSRQPRGQSRVGRARRHAHHRRRHNGERRSRGHARTFAATTA